MRKIKEREMEIIHFLSMIAEVKLLLSSKQIVWEVNPEMGSICADYCPERCRVHPVACCEFNDKDGTSVIVTLLLTKQMYFGELDFWKVTDEPILELPCTNSVFKNTIKFT